MASLRSGRPARPSSSATTPGAGNAVRSSPQIATRSPSSSVMRALSATACAARMRWLRTNQAPASKGDGKLTGPQPRIARLQATDRGVALAHVGKARAVDVEREDPLDLARRGARLGGPRDLDHELAVLAAHAGPGGPPLAVGHEGEVQVADLPAALVHRRREALEEADRGVQRERPARLERVLPRHPHLRRLPACCIRRESSFLTPHAEPGQRVGTDRIRWVASGAARRPGESMAVSPASRRSACSARPPAARRTRSGESSSRCRPGT